MVPGKLLSRNTGRMFRIPKQRVYETLPAWEGPPVSGGARIPRWRILAAHRAGLEAVVSPIRYLQDLHEAGLRELRATMEALSNHGSNFRSSSPTGARGGGALRVRPPSRRSVPSKDSPSPASNYPGLYSERSCAPHCIAEKARTSWYDPVGTGKGIWQSLWECSLSDGPRSDSSPRRACHPRPPEEAAQESVASRLLVTAERWSVIITTNLEFFTDHPFVIVAPSSKKIKASYPGKSAASGFRVGRFLGPGGEFWRTVSTCCAGKRISGNPRA